MTLRDVHGDDLREEHSYEHSACPDLHCCRCECRTCKRAWWAAGRPHPRDCPDPAHRDHEGLLDDVHAGGGPAIAFDEPWGVE